MHLDIFQVPVYFLDDGMFFDGVLVYFDGEQGGVAVILVRFECMLGLQLRTKVL